MLKILLKWRVDAALRPSHSRNARHGGRVALDDQPCETIETSEALHLRNVLGPLRRQQQGQTGSLMRGLLGK
jgi:hypothetical protein